MNETEIKNYVAGFQYKPNWWFSTSLFYNNGFTLIGRALMPSTIKTFNPRGACDILQAVLTGHIEPTGPTGKLLRIYNYNWDLASSVAKEIEDAWVVVEIKLDIHSSDITENKLRKSVEHIVFHAEEHERHEFLTHNGEHLTAPHKPGSGRTFDIPPLIFDETPQEVDTEKPAPGPRPTKMHLWRRSRSAA